MRKEKHMSDESTERLATAAERLEAAGTANSQWPNADTEPGWKPGRDLPRTPPDGTWNGKAAYPHNFPRSLITSDVKARKALPIVTGVLDYFPDALLAVAEVSKAGNDQHNPGQPLHWSREKSTDHADCVGRHLIERGTRDTDGGRHTAKTAWRILALLQLEIEAERQSNLAQSARAEFYRESDE
jgi:hypothetical protein